MRFFSNKKGDTGSGASALVLLISLIIVFYILAVDPAVRNEILSDGETQGSNPSVGNDGVPSLLDVQPGSLDEQNSDSRNIGLDSIIIEEKKTTISPVKDKSVYVRSSVFSEKQDEFSFKLDFPESSELLLSFRAKEMDGRLVVLLNGEVIFDEEITSVTPNPIQLPQSMLKNENLLQFRVSDPGYKFWDSNEYVLEQVSVSGSFTDKSQLEGTQNFVILGGNELLNIEKATLKYVAICNPSDRGKLTVTLNGNVLKSYLPECLSNPENIDFSPDQLKTGDNTLTFSALSGDFIIDQPKIKVNFKNPGVKDYSFKLTEEQYSELSTTNKELELSLEFSTNSPKSLTIRINGESIDLENAGRVFTTNIESYARLGNNYITLEPKSEDINVVNLRVRIR